MSIASETAAVILEIRMRRLASNLWQAVLVDDAELAAVAATPGGARDELRDLVSIALGVPAAIVLFSTASGPDQAEVPAWDPDQAYIPAWDSEFEPRFHVFA